MMTTLYGVGVGAKSTRMTRSDIRLWSSLRSHHHGHKKVYLNLLTNYRLGCKICSSSLHRRGLVLDWRWMMVPHSVWHNLKRVWYDRHFIKTRYVFGNLLSSAYFWLGIVMMISTHCFWITYYNKEYSWNTLWVIRAYTRTVPTCWYDMYHDVVLSNKTPDNCNAAFWTDYKFDKLFLAPCHSLSFEVIDALL